ncbi:hypothetical protein M436DRAFT_76983 [Aureobasidium namibiae CBS 147.97]|uniref:Uncharacterized protein n=1 Tax=Aureobasidium namibiae CBS 147.97 TaxID=1043004 RepID=A0A074W9Q8_9PEZI
MDVRPLEGSARVSKWPVVVTTTVEEEILLESLRDPALVLVGKTDLSLLITDVKSTAIKTFQSPFVFDDFMESCEALETFMSARVSSKDLSQEFFVILDEYTKGKKPTCQIAIDGRGIEDINEMQFSFRCDLSSVHEALNAVESVPTDLSLAIRLRRNEAVMVGGVWSSGAVTRLEAMPNHLGTEQPKGLKQRDDVGSSIGTDRDAPYCPIFLTATISFKTLKDFVRQAYDQDWGTDEDCTVGPAMAFVTSIDKPPFCSGKASQLMEVMPETASSVIGMTAGECNAVASGKFATIESNLDHNMFIVLDEYTEKDRTVIVATNAEQDGQLLLMRCSFESALLSLVAISDTCLTIDSQCNNANTDGDGVVRT